MCSFSVCHFNCFRFLHHRRLPPQSWTHEQDWIIGSTLKYVFNRIVFFKFSWYPIDSQPVVCNALLCILAFICSHRSSVNHSLRLAISVAGLHCFGHVWSFRFLLQILPLLAHKEYFETARVRHSPSWGKPFSTGGASTSEFLNLDLSLPISGWGQLLVF